MRQPPQTYRFIQHAERAAIAQAVRPGCASRHDHLLELISVLDCALLIAGPGMARIVCDREVFLAGKDDARYAFESAVTILRESEVQIGWLR